MAEQSPYLSEIKPFWRTAFYLAVLAMGCVPVSAALAAIAPAPRSAEAQTKAALERIARLNPQIHAVIAVDPTAMDQARALDATRADHGPIHGMAVLVKDNIETKGPLPTTAGSLALLNNVTGRDAPLVARVRAAGGVIIGKTNL